MPDDKLRPGNTRTNYSDLFYFIPWIKPKPIISNSTADMPEDFTTFISDLKIIKNSVVDSQTSVSIKKSKYMNIFNKTFLCLAILGQVRSVNNNFIKNDNLRPISKPDEDDLPFRFTNANRVPCNSELFSDSGELIFKATIPPAITSSPLLIKPEKLVSTESDIVLAEPAWDNSRRNEGSNFIYRTTNSERKRAIRALPAYSVNNKRRYLSKLTSYLNRDKWVVNENSPNSVIGYTVLELIERDPSEQKKIARILLYGTGFYGEKKKEALSHDAVISLLRDFLSEMLLDTDLYSYTLGVFTEKRLIGTKDFHETIKDIGKRVLYLTPAQREKKNVFAYFNQNFLYPIIPLLYIDLDIMHMGNMLVGSYSWFIAMLHAKTRSPGNESIKDNNSFSFFKEAVSRLTENINSFYSEDPLSAEMIIKMSWLYHNQNKDSSSLPEFDDLIQAFYKGLYEKLDKESTAANDFKHAVDEIERINVDKKPYSYIETIISLAKRTCGNRIKLYKSANLIERILRTGNKAYWDKGNFIETVAPTTVVDAADLDDSTTVYCSSKPDSLPSERIRSDIKKISPLRAEYNRTIHTFFDKIRNKNALLIEQILTPCDYIDEDFPAGDYYIIKNSTISTYNLGVECTYLGNYKKLESSIARRKNIYITLNANENCVFLKIKGSDYVIYPFYFTYKLVKINYDIEPYLIRNCMPELPYQCQNANSKFHFKENGVIKKENETVAILAERIAELQFRHKAISLYRTSMEKSTKYVITELALDTLIPFYSCIKSIKNTDAGEIIFNCGIDLFFVVIPFIAGASSIGLKLHAGMFKNVGNGRFILDAKYGVHFTSKVTSTKMTLRDFVYSFETTLDIVDKQLFFKVPRLMFDVIDPGIIFLYNHKKLFRDLKKIKPGNFFDFSFSSQRSLSKIYNVADFVIRAHNSIKISSSLKNVFRTMNIGISSEVIRNKEHSVNDYAALIYINNNAYHTQTIMNHTVIIGKLDKVSNMAAAVYSSPDIDGNAFLMNQFVCSDESHVRCDLIPWEPEIVTIKSEVMKLKPTIRKINNETIYLTEVSDLSRPVIFPDYKITLKNTGYRSKERFSVFLADNVYRYIDTSSLEIKLLYHGDEMQVKTDAQNSVWLETNATHLGIAKFPDSVKMNFLTFPRFSVNESLCYNATLEPDLYLFSLYTRINSKCFRLKIEATQAWFLITPDDQNIPFLRVTWSEREKSLVLAAPYLGKVSSVHAGYSLSEPKLTNQRRRCGKMNIPGLPMMLLSGTIKHAGKSYILLNNFYYQLEPTDTGLYQIKCKDNIHISSCLRFDNFLKTFEVLNKEKYNDCDKDSITVTESDFEKMVRRYFNNSLWTKSSEIINITKNVNTTVLTLRLHETAFLQQMNPVDRMDVLSLPLAQLNAWELHPDATPLAMRYPFLALGLTLVYRLAPLWQSTIPTVIKRTLSIPLNTTYVTSYSPFGRLYLGNRDAYASWIPVAIPHRFRENISLPSDIYQFKDEIYGVDNIIKENITKWIPHENYINHVTVTQFMFEKDKHIEFFEEIPLGNIIINHPELKTIKTYGYTKPIINCISSPDDRWIGLITKKRIYTYNIDDFKKLTPYLTPRSSWPNQEISGAKKKTCTQWLINNSGEVYSPLENSWINVYNKVVYKYFSKLTAIFISPDQRFVGLVPDNTDIIFNQIALYDRMRNTYFYLEGIGDQNASPVISAVSFSPLNLLIAIACMNSNIYIYEFFNNKNGDYLYPVSILKLEKLYYDGPDGLSIEDQSMVMRFQGVFKELSVIYNKGIHGPTYNNVTYFFESYPLSLL